MNYDMIIIGAGSAGLTVASVASQLGLSVALIEGGEMGGDCLNYGCVPSKALIKTASAAYKATHADKFGIHAKDIKINWDEVKAHIQGSIDHIAPHDSQERFEGLGADVFRSYAKFENDKTISLEDGTKLSAKKIIIATGSHAFVPPIQGLKETGYVTNETVFTMDTFPKRLMVIGTGPIGCELGQSFRRLGAEVHLLNRSDRIHGKDDEDMTAFIQDQFTKEELIMHFNSEVINVEAKGNEKVLTIKEKESGAEKTIIVDEILVATGRKPSIDKLELEKAGILTDKRGIKVDKSMKTNKKHIYAIGDCNGLPQFTHNAGYQAGLVIKNAIFKLPASYSERVLPYATYTDPPLATVGLNETRAKEQGMSYTVAEKSFDHLDRAVTDGTNTGKCKILLNKKGRIIGASIVGPSAPELIHEIALAMEANLKATKITGMIHAYPTLSDIIRQTISAHYSTSLFSPRVKKILSLLFGYGKKK